MNYKMKVIEAVTPAAGFGMVSLPVTKAHPKEMMPMLDKVTFMLKAAIDSGSDGVLSTTGRGNQSIEWHFDRSDTLECGLKGILYDIENIQDWKRINLELEISHGDSETTKIVKTLGRVI